VIRAEHLARVRNAVEAKAGKQYEPHTVLIVAVDDSVGFRDEDDVARLAQLTEQTLIGLLAGTNFTALSLQGTQLHLFYPIV
jgi:hypothetical protein